MQTSIILYAFVVKRVYIQALAFEDCNLESKDYLAVVLPNSSVSRSKSALPPMNVRFQMQYCKVTRHLISLTRQTCCIIDMRWLFVYNHSFAPAYLWKWARGVGITNLFQQHIHAVLQSDNNASHILNTANMLYYRYEMGFRLQSFICSHIFGEMGQGSWDHQFIPTAHSCSIAK